MGVDFFVSELTEKYLQKPHFYRPFCPKIQNKMWLNDKHGIMITKPLKIIFKTIHTLFNFKDTVCSKYATLFYFRLFYFVFSRQVYDWANYSLLKHSYNCTNSRRDEITCDF